MLSICLKQGILGAYWALVLNLVGSKWFQSGPICSAWVQYGPIGCVLVLLSQVCCRCVQLDLLHLVRSLIQISEHKGYHYPLITNYSACTLLRPNSRKHLDLTLMYLQVGYPDIGDFVCDLWLLKILKPLMKPGWCHVHCTPSTLHGCNFWLNIECNTYDEFQLTQP